MADARRPKTSPHACTCGCRVKVDAAYWHAWQAGRARGWDESYGRPVWWMRLTTWLREVLPRG